MKVRYVKYYVARHKYFVNYGFEPKLEFFRRRAGNEARYLKTNQALVE